MGNFIFYFSSTLFLAFFSLNPSFAFNEKDLARLLQSNECKFCNLHSANLSGANLSGSQLSNSVLTHANLSGANLSRANLSGAFLTNANLSGANLADAFMVDANLSDVNLSDTNLAGANLSGATWTDRQKCGKDSYGECKRTTLEGAPSSPEGSRSRTPDTPAWLPGGR